MKKIFSLLLVAVLIFSLSVSAFAFNEIPELPDPYSVITDEFKERFPYLVVYNFIPSNKYFLEALSSEPFFTASGSGLVQPYEKNGESFYRLRWEFDPATDSNWTRYSGISDTVLSVSNSTTSQIATSFDARTEDGTIILQADNDFFQLPPPLLWMETMEVTQGEVPNLTVETAKTMGLLMVCGVGLMASLMGFYLLVKRFPLFLGK